MRRESGFTILEVLVAATILVVAVSALASLLSSTTAVNVSARHATRAVLLAMEKMEQLRALPFDDPALAASPPGTLEADVAGFSDAPADGYRRRWSIAPLDALPASACVVQVLVWSPGDPSEASLVTIKA